MPPISVPRVSLISIAAAFALATIAFAQCPPPAWSAMNQVPAVNGTVRAIKTWDPDGAGPQPALVVVGGTFTWAGSANVAAFDGVNWLSLGTGVNDSIYDFTVFNGELIAGGAFTTASGGSALRIARWNGTAWAPLGTGMNHPVFSLSVYNGELIAGGDFTVAGSVGANHVAKWDGAGWAPLTEGCDLAVQALAVYNGELVASGHFAHAGLVDAANIARWNGSVWQPLGNGVGIFFFNSVGALDVYNGELIAGGNFNDASGVPVSNVARWNGSVWQSVGGGIGAGVYAFAHAGPDLIASGANFITRWNGIMWQSTGAVSGLAGTLGSYGNGVLAGGNLISVAGVNAPFLARWWTPQPSISVSQPLGSELGVQIQSSWLIPGHEYFNIASLNPCAGGAGTGPYGGLCFPNLADLEWQLLLPVGSPPFHFIATQPTATFGLFSLPFGLSFEAICVDVTAVATGCPSFVVGHTVY
jgi:hypothetical protein